MIDLNTNITEETLQKLSLIISREVWIELHKCSDDVSEDKIHDVCLQFSVSNPSDDIVTHLAKLDNLENQLKQVMMKDVLPYIFSGCKILSTLPEDHIYFNPVGCLCQKMIGDLIICESTLYMWKRIVKVLEYTAEKTLAIDTTKKSTSESKQMKKIICNYCKNPITQVFLYLKIFT